MLNRNRSTNYSSSSAMMPSYLYGERGGSNYMNNAATNYYSNDPNYHNQIMYNRRGGYNNSNNYMIGNEPLYLEDKLFDDEMIMYDRPTYRPSKMIGNPDFGNFHYKKGFTAEVWLNDGETVVLSGDTRKKSYRTHYSPEYLRSFFFGWFGRLLRYLWLDRLFGLHVDTVKEVKTRNYIFVTANILPDK
ncbi:hypothetical protein ABK040_012130 [Willaertia magna]